MVRGLAGGPSRLLAPHHLEGHAIGPAGGGYAGVTTGAKCVWRTSLGCACRQFSRREPWPRCVWASVRRGRLARKGAGGKAPALHSPTVFPVPTVSSSVKSNGALLGAPRNSPHSLTCSGRTHIWDPSQAPKQITSGDVQGRGRGAGASSQETAWSHVGRHLRSVCRGAWALVPVLPDARTPNSQRKTDVLNQCARLMPAQGSLTTASLTTASLEGGPFSGGSLQPLRGATENGANSLC